MQRVVCKDCCNRFPNETPKTEVYPRTEIEPAEYMRVVKGHAKTPTMQQRTVYVNNVPHLLESGYYNCDFCDAAIQPGDEVTCVTVWNERQREPAAWEHEFLARTK